jgi:periplasmic copper chaperone A
VIKCWLVVFAAGIFSPALPAQENPVSNPGKAVVADPPADAGFPSPVPDSGDTGIEFSDVWVRAIPPFQANSAAYLTLTNHRETAIAITGARSSAAQKTELHTTRMVEGLMRMEKLDGLAVAPGEQVELVPGGKHLMLIGLAFRPVPGDEITLCLQLASAEEVCTLAEVRRSDRSETHDHQH